MRSAQHSRADTLIVVDCLTLWLTARLMPAVGSPHANPPPDGDGTDDCRRAARLRRPHRPDQQ